MKSPAPFTSALVCSLCLLGWSGPVASRAAVSPGPGTECVVAQEPATLPTCDLVVTEITGLGSERLALIQFRQKPWIVHRDMIVEKCFKVVDILPDRLVIQFQNESNRRIFPIGGGKE